MRSAAMSSAICSTGSSLRKICGSIWLANTGDGDLQPEWASYLSENLARASQGNLEQPIVYYCRSDCWLGWNATRRAHALGYTRLYWYRDGVDGWEQAGLPLHPATPEPLQSFIWVFSNSSNQANFPLASK